MEMESLKILVINAGSSSLKFRLFDMPSEDVVCAGVVERIGMEGAAVHYTIGPGQSMQQKELPVSVADHSEAVRQVATLLCKGKQAIVEGPDSIAMVGHRIVHGGEYYATATVITAAVKEKIKQLFPLAPLHNPVGLRCIEVAEAFFPVARQVAVFDTAFHHHLPAVAARYAIPHALYNNDKIRTYGFHGISHKYVTAKAREYLQKDDARMISIHLGNGCSMAAVRGSNALDTSMGFSPLSGLVMGTRSGDIDPEVVLYLQNHAGLSVDYIDTLLNKQSGLLGICGHSDMRDVHKAAAAGNADAQFARELYAYRIRKYLGAYAAVMNGLDAVIFTAGVGEHDPVIREMVCRDLDFFHIVLDKEKNRQKAGDVQEINNADGVVKVLVIPTNEELEIARQCFTLPPVV